MAVSWFTVIDGAATLVASSGLDSRKLGVTGVLGLGLMRLSLKSASCSIKLEKRICSPAVPLTEATLPAKVFRSLVGEVWAIVSPASVRRRTRLENKKTKSIVEMRFIDTPWKNERQTVALDARG